MDEETRITVALQQQLKGLKISVAFLAFETAREKIFNDTSSDRELSILKKIIMEGWQYEASTIAKNISELLDIGRSTLSLT